MHHARFHVFKAVRFLADVFDKPDSGLSSLQQSDRLSVAGVPVRIGAFRFRVKFVLPQNVPVSSDARGISAAMMTVSRDAVLMACILVDPFISKPLFRVRFMWRNQVKPFRVRARGMSERAYLTCDYKIERLDLL